jgi:Bacterial PH domain
VQRRVGTAMPGYLSGWFRLRDGEKALLYLTDRTRAVYVPTRSGYSVLLSVTEPERFLARLREIAPGT